MLGMLGMLGMLKQVRNGESMKEQWLKLAARYDSLQLRERWLIAVAVLGGMVLIAYSLLIEPALQRSQLADRNVAEHRAQISSLQAQMAALQSPAQNPDEIARAEVDDLQRQLGKIAGRLETMESSLVPAQHMSGLLEDMIGRRTGLHLLSLKTLPVAPLLDKKVGAEESEAAKSAGKPINAGLFKHGVEIRLEGSYLELVAYLERLEQTKRKLLWSKLALSADRHPRLVLTLTVFTLSLDRAWLIV